MGIQRGFDDDDDDERHRLGTEAERRAGKGTDRGATERARPVCRERATKVATGHEEDAIRDAQIWHGSGRV